MKIHKPTIFLLIVLLALLGRLPACYSEEMKGVVQKIIDGDSIIVQTEKGVKHEVRLYGIDSPEYDQPYAQLAKKYLVKKVLNKTVYLSIIETDRYKRKIAIVRKENSIINSELVKLGYAWTYTKYCNKNICKSWQKYQKTAKKNRKGLWRDKKPISPWRWRHK